MPKSFKYWLYSNQEQKEKLEKLSNTLAFLGEWALGGTMDQVSQDASLCKISKVLLL